MIIHKIVKRVRDILPYIAEINNIKIITSYLISPPDVKENTYTGFFMTIVCPECGIDCGNDHKIWEIRQFSIGFDANKEADEDLIVGEIIKYITRWAILNEQIQKQSTEATNRGSIEDTQTQNPL